MKKFTGSYIEIILDIARTDRHCAMSFLPADIQSAREELVSLRAELKKADNAGMELMVENEKLRAENERLKGESEVQRGLFNAAMDRAEKAEAENDRLRAVINSHAQSGCNCQFCKDARELAEKDSA